MALEPDDPPLMTTFYGVDASAVLLDPRWKAGYQLLARRGNRFIVLADAVAERLVATGFPEERISVWNIGIDLAPFLAVDRPPRTGPFKVLCAARFVEKKGHRTLLDATSRLARTHEVRVTLVGYGPLREAIARQVEALGLAAAVRIVDTTEVADFTGLLARELAAHDAFVLASTTAPDGDDEGGPALTVVDAQAAGLPVIVTPFVGHERSVVDGETGIVVAEDAEALRAAMARLADDDDLSGALGRRGRAFVAGAFAVEGQNALLCEIYEEVADGAR
jgi:glycosyltransferase involved in cell wall biosynthesis